MISTKHRFHGYNSLRRTYQQGQQVRGPYSSLKFISNERRQTYRVAVVVSRKVHKSAVVRNRIRRRIYEQVRLQEGNITRPYDLVFTIFSEQVAELAVPKLQQLIHDQLKQAKVINN